MRNKLLKVGTVLCIVCFSFISVFAYEKSDYKKNSALSNYLDAERFKLGVNREEANELYEIDYQVSGKMFVYSSRVLDKKINFPKTEGFYEFSFHDSYGNVTDNLYKISKCISIQETSIDERDIVKTFNAKYNVKLPAAVIHHGRYIIVDLNARSSFTSENNYYALILSVEDETEKVLKQESQENEGHSGTNKARRSF